MVDDEIINSFLDGAVNKAKARLEKEGRLDLEDAIPLMLKSQFNHIRHLEMDMVTKTELKAEILGVKSELKDEMRNQLKWIIGISFGQIIAITGIFVGIISVIGK